MEANSSHEIYNIPVIEGPEKQGAVSGSNVNYQSLAINLFVNAGKNKSEVQRTLIVNGMPQAEARILCDKIDDELYAARRQGAQKDMIYGALWCVGGALATAANIGFIFWGAIVFGGIQFFKGLINYQK